MATNRNPLVKVISAVLLIIFSFVPFKALSATPKEIYQKASKGVVLIFVSKGHKKGSIGTGSIIREDGLIVTNAHIFVSKESSDLLSEISIFLKPDKVTGSYKADLGKGYNGKIVAYDRALDLALLKILGADMSLPVVDFADSETIVVGEQVYAIGHPEQGGLWSLTSGVISAHMHDFAGIKGKNLFQTDASINRGNSGGPLLDERGLMVGVNSMIAREAKDGLTITDVNFSIKSSVTLNWLDKVGYRFEPVKFAESEVASEAGEQDLTVKAEKKEAEGGQVEEKAPEKVEVSTEEKVSEKAEVSTEDKVSEKAEVSTEEKVSAFEEKPARKKGLFEELEESDEKEQTGEPAAEKILTDKNPYSIDELIGDIQEMESLMQEMKGKIYEH